MYPLVLTGKLIGLCNPYKKKYTKIFFFPFYHIGGAEKVHYQILEAVGNESCLIYFTRKSKEAGFIDAFKKTKADIKDISKYTDIKALYFLNIIFRGIISAQINCIKTRVMVFNGQCNFGYKISPWIKPDVSQFELIHSFNTFSYIRTPFLPFISKTVMISKVRIEQHITFYKKMGIPDNYADRIVYIANAIELASASEENKNENFTVLFVGRNSPEKRLHLFLQTAQLLYTQNQNVKFEILGDVSESISTADYPFIKFYGNQNDVGVINSIYASAHALMLISSTEGFPMVIIEAMNNRCAILATPVGDIPLHIKNKENGFLFSSVIDEETIVKEATAYILQLKDNKELFSSISKNNRNYAAANFGIEKFNEAYNRLLQS